jgi:hypothetical protein
VFSEVYQCSRLPSTSIPLKMKGGRDVHLRSEMVLGEDATDCSAMLYPDHPEIPRKSLAEH